MDRASSGFSAGVLGVEDELLGQGAHQCNHAYLVACQNGYQFFSAVPNKLCGAAKICKRQTGLISLVTLVIVLTLVLCLVQFGIVIERERIPVRGRF